MLRNCFLQSSKPVIRLPLTVSRIEKDDMNIQQLLCFQSSYTHIPHSHIFRSEHTLGCYCYARQKDNDLKELRLFFWAFYITMSQTSPKLCVHGRKTETIPSRSRRSNHCPHLPAPPQALQNSSALAAVLQKGYHVLRGAPPPGKQQGKIHPPLSIRKVRLIRIASDW